MDDGYAQRTDLTQKLPVSTAKSRSYGDASASRASQQVVPMGNPAVNVPRGTSQRQPLTPLGAPSQRPNEPITAGMNFGPGPNAQQAGIPMAVPTTGDARELLIYLNSQYPNSDIENLLSTLMDD